MRRTIYNEDHEAFRSTLRDFLAKEVAPHFLEWEAAGHVPRDLYRQLGELGIFGIEVPEEYGGSGLKTLKYEAIINEEITRAGVGIGQTMAHSGLCLGYLKRYATDEQMRRWMPDFITGDAMYAVAMTEPGTGSDLAGIKTTAKLSEDGTHYVLNGAKTFISGGLLADRVLVVCRTSPAPAENRRLGLTILHVDAHAEGFAVGRKLDKIGMRSYDTAELSFTDVKVPVEDVLGEEGQAFRYLAENLVSERLQCAVYDVAKAQAAINFALDYTKQRMVFGKPVASFQNTKFVLAECAAETEAGQVMADKALEMYDAGELTPAEAAKLKLFCSELAGRVVDKCLQLHGGYGYMLEYPIARLYADTRVSRIYGGTSEVMKIVIAKDLGL
ncbi:acyl-CoA dehydrogenase family protein [Streptomyces adustus]|uniref:acyl-CoA dehydrogenase family protein n=1 Tax=Streptomyces adustus TaxID=1609272 RepID=UPI003714A206